MTITATQSLETLLTLFCSGELMPFPVQLDLEAYQSQRRLHLKPERFLVHQQASYDVSRDIAARLLERHFPTGLLILH